jgi:hypothetical protein
LTFVDNCYRQKAYIVGLIEKSCRKKIKHPLPFTPYARLMVDEKTKAGILRTKLHYPPNLRYRFNLKIKNVYVYIASFYFWYK